MRRILLFAFPLFLLVTCKDNIRHQLDTAESCISSRPDSALAVLLAIPQTDLKTKKDVARHALLLSLAYDKNYIDIKSDSLARIAVDYYSQRKCSRERMLAWYSLGIVLKNAKDYIPSMLAFEKAEADATVLKEYLYLGLVNRNRATLFNLTNNTSAAIESRIKAIDSFEAASASLYTLYAQYSLAIDYSNHKDFRQADSLLQVVLQSATRESLVNLCEIRLAGLWVQQDTLFQEAIQLFRGRPRSLFTVLEYAYLAQAFEMTGQKDSADHWMAEGYAYCQNREQEATLDYMKSRLLLHRGDYKSAFYLVDHATDVQDSLTRILLEQSVSVAQRDYYKNETLLREERIRRMRERMVMGVVLALIALSLFVMVVVSESRKKDRLLHEQMALLALEERDLNLVKKEKAQLVGSLFNEKIGHLEELNAHYFQEEDEGQKERIFRQIKQVVASMHKDETLFPSLERDLDRYCNGVMSKFRQQVPSIKRENHLHTVMLFFAGFSYPVVQLILNKPSVESLKMDRSRFRKEVLSSGAEDTELFLTMLEIRKRPQAGTNEKF